MHADHHCRLLDDKLPFGKMLRELSDEGHLRDWNHSC